MITNLLLQVNWFMTLLRTIGHTLPLYSSASNNTKKRKDTNSAHLEEKPQCSLFSYFDVVAGACMAFNNIASVVA